MAQAIPFCGMRMVVVVNCCQNSLARVIDLRAYAWERLLCRPSWESALLWCRAASERQLDWSARSSAIEMPRVIALHAVTKRA